MSDTPTEGTRMTADDLRAVADRVMRYLDPDTQAKSVYGLGDEDCYREWINDVKSLAAQHRADDGEPGSIEWLRACSKIVPLGTPVTKDEWDKVGITVRLKTRHEQLTAITLSLPFGSLTKGRYRGLFAALGVPLSEGEPAKAADRECPDCPQLPEEMGGGGWDDCPKCNGTGRVPLAEGGGA